MAVASHFRNLSCVSTTFCVLLCMSSAISQEGEALLRWKSTLLNSTSLSLWSHANPTNYWDGVTFDDVGRVTELDLPGYGLSGALDALCSATFRHLTLLNLCCNNLVGAIPTNISLLLALTYVDLSNNNLVGDIPYQLSRLQKIATLDLTNNHLTNPEHAKFLPMSSLMYLHLGGNKLNGTLPPFILNGNFVRLMELDLSCNAFSGSVPDNLQEMAPSLLVLDLSSNMFSGLIPRSFSKLATLVTLYLANNTLNGEIPKELGNLTNIRQMDLSCNMFSGGIPKELGNLTQLTHMNLSWNRLSGGLPPSFSRIQNMLEFDVGNNLHLSGNIPLEWFSNWTLLEVLNIANNTFTGSISEAFCQLSKLDSIDLSNNILSGVLPGCLWQMGSLIYMDLSSNVLTGEVPTSKNHSSSLQLVHLANNNLKGYFPPVLKKLQSLLSLDLGGNKFSSTIPSWVGASFPLLRILRLRSNMFHGSIPWELSQLSHLQLIDLAENNLTGSIPASFSNFTCIEPMIPASYQFGDHNSIFRDADTQSGLTVFTYNGTMYSHEGQMDIVWKGRDYTFSRGIMLMTGIDLSSNYLSGEIPSELLNLQAIHFLNLSINNLSGGIPSNIGNLKDVESLDLSWNKLPGPIPPSIAHLMFLSSLNLSNNLLLGEIPSGNQLQTLNDPTIYSNNLGLCGVPLSIPCKNGSSSTTALDGAKEDHHQLETLWLYYSVIGGTVFGFWIWFGTLFFWNTWRFMFFRCIDAMQQKFMQKMKRT